MNINEQFASPQAFQGVNKVDDLPAPMRVITTGVVLRYIHFFIDLLSDQNLADLDKMLSDRIDSTNCPSAKKGAQNIRTLIRLARSFRAECETHMMTKAQMAEAQQECNCGCASPEEPKCA